MVRRTLSVATRGLALGACAALPLLAGAALAAERPDIVVAVNSLPRSLDPGTETGNVDVRVYYNIFDTLIRRDFAHPDADGGARLVPGLAVSWTRPDPNTLELDLRQGVTCHDGSPFDADDVLATFAPERLWGADPFYPKGREDLAQLKSVAKVVADTARFTTLSFPPFTSWCVLTDMVSHAAVSGRYALVNTFYVKLERCAVPDLAPFNVMARG